MRQPRVLTEDQKEAARVRARNWHHSNKEKAAANSANWRKKNSQRVKENNARYESANKELVRERKKAYAKKNAEKIAAYHAEYRKKHSEKIAEYRSTHKSARLVIQNNRRARAASSGVLPTDIVSVLMTLQRSKCANCKTCLKTNGKHLDHKIPLSKGGSNTFENVELLCPTCNLRKHDKDPIDWATQNGRLL